MPDTGNKVNIERLSGDTPLPSAEKVLYRVLDSIFRGLEDK